MDTKQLMVKSALDAWTSRCDAANKLFASLTDEDLAKEVAPGKNRALYLMGHLAVVHDKMLPLLNFGPQMYPDLEEAFLHKPDRSVADIPTITEIRAVWDNVHSRLNDYMNKLTPDEWFQKHTAVSDDDFVNEPHRNRINVLVGRTNHMQYHMGQVALIK